MPVELYETLYMLDSNKMASEAETIRTALHTSLEKHGGQIVVSRSWDETRKLAYPIRKSNTTHKKAYYYIIYYKMESTNQGALDTDMRLTMSDYLLRYMTSHIDAKWAEAVLDVAQKETSPAFSLRGMQEESTPTEINPPLGEGMPMDLMGDLGNGAPSGDRGDRGDRRPPRRRSDGPEKPE